MTRHRDPEIAAEWIRGAFGWIVITFVAILAIPVLIGVLRHASFETRRRAESDFAPTGDDEEDDD